MSHTYIPSLRLDQLTDQPELTVTIAGQQFSFSELTLEAKGRLQAWLAVNSPNPIDSIKDDLEGLSIEDRQFLLNEARKDRKSWPPEIQSAAGKMALLSTEPGQLEAMFEGLRIHQPEITRPGAYKLMRALKREANAEASQARRAGRKPKRLSKVDRIIGVMLALDLPDDDDEETDVPKAPELPTTNGSIGSSYSGDASKNSA